MTEPRHEPTTQPSASNARRRRPDPREEPRIARAEVVVQGMRISLPALRFLETGESPARRA